MKQGIYIHVPFCASKCPYCDFYSLTATDEGLKDAYTDALCREMQKQVGKQADTLYFGGGTPTLLGAQRIARLTAVARECFAIPETEEITLEANPADHLYETFKAFAEQGGNRISLGMQSTDADILKILGRRHTPADVCRTIEDARRAGIENISLDLMLAVPTQTKAHIEKDIAMCAELGASHVSAYLLKVEEGTPFAAMGENLAVPDDDTAADYYLYAVERLQAYGYAQYEISNFAKQGKESRHNLKYWKLEPYIGFGPAAHSFDGGKRWYYPRDIQAFIDGQPPICDVDGGIAVGSETEYAMLALRLREGLRVAQFYERFGERIPTAWMSAAAALPCSLVEMDETGISLTAEGFLVSDALIVRILNL